MTKPKIGKPPGIKKKVQFEERHIPETEDSKAAKPTKPIESIPVEMICLGCCSIQNASLTCSQSETIAAGVMTGFCKKCQDEKKHLWEEPIAKHTFISRFWKHLINFGRK